MTIHNYLWNCSLDSTLYLLLVWSSDSFDYSTFKFTTKEIHCPVDTRSHSWQMDISYTFENRRYTGIGLFPHVCSIPVCDEDNYVMHEVIKMIVSQFTPFWYMQIAKPLMYSEHDKEADRTVLQTFMLKVIIKLFFLLHPSLSEIRLNMLISRNSV